MWSNERQEKILSILREKGSATVGELAGVLFASEATVRRDLAQMQDLGLLKRSHGGAILLQAADEISIFVRMTENAPQKEQIASKALRILPTDFNSVFLDSSSTVLALAQRMNLADKTVVTNSLHSAMQLSHVRGINLIVPGGNVSVHGGSIAGSWASRLLEEFRFDLMLTSCAAFDHAYAYETSLDQREIKRTVFDRSACRFLLADRSKLAAGGVYRFEPLSAFDGIVADRLTEEERAAMKELPLYTA